MVTKSASSTTINRRIVFRSIPTYFLFHTVTSAPSIYTTSSICTMPASFSESYRNNQTATSTFMTPFGIPFFGWSDGEYVKLTMEELRPMYDAWEKHIAALKAAKAQDELAAGEAAQVAAEYETPVAVVSTLRTRSVNSILMFSVHRTVVGRRSRRRALLPWSRL